MKSFKHQYPLLLLMLSFGMTAFSQTKEELKKKYENSSIDQELKKKMATEFVFPDSLILPPLHYTNSYYVLDSAINDFQSISIDIIVQDDIPDHYSFYISPFNIALNDIPLYCGIQSAGGGISVKTGKEQEIKFNGIFSRWFERTKKALKTTGYYASSDAEGDFISVRNTVGWHKGAYRITLKKDGYIPGKAVPDSINHKETYFSWGDYEHSWITMYVEDLSSKKISNVGSLAFPGKKIKMEKQIISFLEQYKYFIDFAQRPRNLEGMTVIHYDKLPKVTIIQKNLQINGKTVHLEKVPTSHNRTHNPEQSKVAGEMPILSKDSYNPSTGELTLETGVFVGWPEKRETE
ncbi:hypothetical protein [Sphingobacterium sp. BIGb0165]|uniref:hypothetical protein n=1 Tax=Sphingobacterium sp. BIGb0165 TaxID=2940615 RepID=UPI002167B71A|nr:hypothetical protein [Sphingobacterium sp. BIGb0165]MCS4226632.1 hypothetical protein [Sphingobacterium sp. BIGb0165]